MAIRDNIQEKADLIHAERLAKQADPNAATPVSDEVQTKATSAIIGGTIEWVAYMRLFAKSDSELARLIPTDGTTDDTRNQARAYLAANGMCGSGTGDKLLDNVTAKLNLP